MFLPPDPSLCWLPNLKGQDLCFTAGPDGCRVKRFQGTLLDLVMVNSPRVPLNLKAASMSPDLYNPSN